MMTGALNYSSSLTFLWGKKLVVQTPCFLRVKIGAITWHTKLGLQIEGFFDLEQVDRQH